MTKFFLLSSLALSCFVLMLDLVFGDYPNAGVMALIAFNSLMGIFYHD